MVKLPELNQARVNKCLIALVNRKIVRKDSTSVRPPFKVVWCEFMLNSYRVVCCIFGMAWRHSIVDSSILPLPISVLDICTSVSIFLFSCIRCINIPQNFDPTIVIYLCIRKVQYNSTCIRYGIGDGAPWKQIETGLHCKNYGNFFSHWRHPNG